MFASKARYGPTPLRYIVRGIGIVWGSVPPIYTKGDTPYYIAAFAMAPQNQACARWKTRTRGSFRAIREGRI